jgi:hypothetical protein
MAEAALLSMSFEDKLMSYLPHPFLCYRLCVKKAPLRLDKRDRPSRLHPHIARSGEGDARVKAGGASGKHLGRTTEPELITRRGTHGGTVRLDTSTMPALIAYFRPV